MTIRMATEQDAEAIAEIYRPSVVDRATSFEVVAPTAGEMAGRIRALRQFAPWLVWAGAGDRPHGFAYASPHSDRPAYRWSVNVTVYIDAAQHRRGIGRALYQTLFS